MARRWVTVGVVAALLTAGGVYVGTQMVKRRTPEDRKGKGGLESLGYLSTAHPREADKHKRGTVRHVEGKAFDGYTLVVPAAATLPPEDKIKEATLVDMNGEALHTWSGDPFEGDRSWVVGRLDEHGFMYALSMLGGMVKLDWESEVVWSYAEEVHHDFTFAPTGVVALVARNHDIPVPGSDDTLMLRDNGLVFLDHDGEKIRELWYYDTFKDDPDFVRRIKKKAERKQEGQVVDVFHANVVEILPRDVEGLGNEGDILTSIRNLEFVAVISADGGDVKWKWGRKMLQRQHDPHLTPEQTITIYDNGVRRKRSRVLEVSPAKTRKKIVWRFNGGKERFFSSNRGMAQPLPNGNILISVSNEAKLMEVTKDKDVVWDYYSPREHPGGRYPIRGVRLMGAAQEAVQAIVEGTRPPPSKDDDTARRPGPATVAGVGAAALAAAGGVPAGGASDDADGTEGDAEEEGDVQTDATEAG